MFARRQRRDFEREEGPGVVVTAPVERSRLPCTPIHADLHPIERGPVGERDAEDAEAVARASHARDGGLQAQPCHGRLDPLGSTVHLARHQRDIILRHEPRHEAVCAELDAVEPLHLRDPVPTGNDQTDREAMNHREGRTVLLVREDGIRLADGLERHGSREVLLVLRVADGLGTRVGRPEVHLACVVGPPRLLEQREQGRTGPFGIADHAVEQASRVAAALEDGGARDARARAELVESQLERASCEAAQAEPVGRAVQLREPVMRHDEVVLYGGDPGLEPAQVLCRAVLPWELLRSRAHTREVVRDVREGDDRFLDEPMVGEAPHGGHGQSDANDSHAAEHIPACHVSHEVSLVGSQAVVRAGPPPLARGGSRYRSHIVRARGRRRRGDGSCDTRGGPRPARLHARPCPARCR